MPPQQLARDPREPKLRVVPGGAAARGTAESDAELLRAFEEGRPSAGTALYDRLFPVVEATLVRIVGRREQDHPDLVQCAFEQIVSTILNRKYARGCSLTGWAVVVTSHVGLKALRGRRRERTVLDRDRQVGPSDLAVQSRAPSPESQVRIREELDRVRGHLAEMDSDRVVTLLLGAAGHDLSEIAHLTNTSVAAAQSRLSRGRRELSARLRKEQSLQTMALSSRSRP